MWFVKSVLGILCLLFIYTLLVFVNYTIVCASYDFPYHLFFYEVFAVLFLVTHFKAICTNPGTLQQHYTSLDPTVLPPPFSMVMEQRPSSCQGHHQPSDQRPGSLRSTVNPVRGQVMSTPGRMSPQPSFFETKTELSHGAESLAQMIDISLQRYLGETYAQGINTGETSRSEATSEVQLQLDERGLPQSQDNIQIWKKRVKDVLNRKCENCDSMKPPRAHHCRTCGRCVMRMDHHCPWINNCVGANNQKHFLQFLIVTCIATAYSAVFLFIQTAVIFMRGDYVLLVGNPVSYFRIFAVSLFVFSFSSFPWLCQWISYAASLITHQTRKLTTRLTFEESFGEVFGGKFGCSWFCPTGVNKARVMEEEYSWANLN